jgi:1,2-phenylacetyl-CoA epoxidase PaaB subunit
MRLSATKRRHAGMNGENSLKDDEIELAVRSAIRAFHRKSLATSFAAAYSSLIAATNPDERTEP